MVEHVHSDPSPQHGTRDHIFLDLFQNLIGAILSVLVYMLVDSKALVVTSLISMIDRLSLLEMLIRVELRMCLHRSGCTYM